MTKSVEVPLHETSGHISVEPLELPGLRGCPNNPYKWCTLTENPLRSTTSITHINGTISKMEDVMLRGLDKLAMTKTMLDITVDENTPPTFPLYYTLSCSAEAPTPSSQNSSLSFFSLSFSRYRSKLASSGLNTFP